MYKVIYFSGCWMNKLYIRNGAFIYSGEQTGHWTERGYVCSKEPHTGIHTEAQCDEDSQPQHIGCLFNQFSYPPPSDTCVLIVCWAE